MEEIRLESGVVLLFYTLCFSAVHVVIIVLVVCPFMWRLAVLLGPRVA